MIEKTKIIYILCHNPHPIIKNITNPKEYFVSSAEGEYILLNDFPYWVGFFTKDHHVTAATGLKKLTDEFEIECWRPYGNSINRIYSKKIDGIVHRVFPSYSISIPQVGHGIFSPSFLNFLIDYAKNYKVIINISTGHAWFHIWLFLKLRKIKHKFPIVATQISGGFKRDNYRQLHPLKKLVKWYYLIENAIDLRSLKHVDKYLVGSKIEFDFLLKRPDINASFYNPGVDFNYFIQSDKKQEIRAEYGLPQDKKIMIVTGNFRSNDYGYHNLIECYAAIKREYDDLLLIMIGGYKNEDLYNLGLQSGAVMVERVPREILLKYYQASDFYGQPSLNYGFISYGGFGYAMMEALACGLPVLSQNIIHFPGTIEERAKIGLDMPTKEDLQRNMIYLKDNYQKYSECRDVARKYFNAEKNKAFLLDIYRNLAGEYFTESR